MKKLQYSFEEINTKIITYFLITFFLIYGINLFTTGFAIQYSSPLDNNLNPNLTQKKSSTPILSYPSSSSLTSY